MLKSAPKIMVMEAKILRFFFKNFNLLNVLLLKLYYYFCFLNYYSGAPFNIFFVNKAIQNNKKIGNIEITYMISLVSEQRRRSKEMQYSNVGI
jgi:hypothetical protein